MNILDIIKPNTFAKSIKALEDEYARLQAINKHLKEENQYLKDELVKDHEIARLNEVIENKNEQIRHYSMPDSIWQLMEKHREENNIQCWDKIEIVELPMAVAYTCIYKDLEFTEYC